MVARTAWTWPRRMREAMLAGRPPHSQMVIEHGAGPVGAYCGACRHFAAKGDSQLFAHWTCGRYREITSDAPTWNNAAPGCGAYQQRPGGEGEA